MARRGADRASVHFTETTQRNEQSVFMFIFVQLLGAADLYRPPRGDRRVQQQLRHRTGMTTMEAQDFAETTPELQGTGLEVTLLHIRALMLPPADPIA